MINNYLGTQIKGNFLFPPTPDQENVLKMLADFVVSPQNGLVFLLKGYAGTGKTSLVAALIRTLVPLGQRVALLAPTGRAAKVLAGYAGQPATTIHKRIYRQRVFVGDERGSFELAPNLQGHTLYIVDEASMIAGGGLSGAMFGTGRLLDDLVTFVYGGQGCRLLLLGDTAQLPPVGEELSLALSPEHLRGYGLDVLTAELTQVVRQEAASGILYNVTQLRLLIAQGLCDSLPRVRLTGFADIRRLPGGELIDELSSCYDRDGLDQTIVICRSNKRANIYNQGIRAQILWREEELESDDLLMVARNNYHWMRNNEEEERTENLRREESRLAEEPNRGQSERNGARSLAGQPMAEDQLGGGSPLGSSAVDFIANGETVVVRRVRHERELYGFRFADVTLTLTDREDEEIDATVLLDTLHAEAPALTRDQSARLFQAVLDDYADLPTKRERMRKVREDAYYNALQVKYAYAVTCHKAQGGQWRNVFLDQGYLTDDQLTPDYFRWLYTAFTRATGTLYLVNYPADHVE